MNFTRQDAHRLRSTVRQFIKFGVVGGSGVFVNLLVFFLADKVAGWTGGVTKEQPFMNLLGSVFHIRWYHVFATIAFVVANTWNYQFNRMWTFKSDYLSSWWRGFFPFLATGVIGFLVTLAVVTALMNPHSPLGYFDDFLDGSTGLRTKVNWAYLASILVAMPVNFLVNKLWTFRKTPLVVVEETEPKAAS